MEKKYNYKDLSQKAKKVAYQSTLEFYDYAIKEMLNNSVFNKNGKRIESVSMKDVLI